MQPADFNQQEVTKTITLVDLEEKLDKILKYQKSARRFAILRGIISFTFFMVFIVLPIIGSFYLFKFFQENIDFEKISGQYKGFYETMESLKETTGKVGSLDELIHNMPNLDKN